MSQVAYLWDSISLKHDTGRHVEQIARAERLCPDRIGASLIGATFPEIQEHDAVEAILRVHGREYVDWVRSVCEGGGGLLDAGDTVVSRDSYDAAIAGVNAGLTGVDLVMGDSGERRAFCAMRPPGHHALPDRAMGFCLFANVSIAARYAQAAYGVERVAIVDFDVHHGNGTQDIFYADGSVLFVSMHQHPLWPMSGLANECGVGDGIGTTLNLPLAPGTTEAEQLQTFREKVLHAVQSFRPALLFISAGFDAHRDDPLGGLMMTEAGFAEMTQGLVDVAAACCEGRVVSFLEGGYNLDALESSVVSHVGALRGG